MDQVEQIREKTDLVAFITEHVPLKKAGKNFQGLCPFHSEKTPSFVVSPDRQIWHCFGCGKGGDIYSFLMEYERLEFPEALRILARLTGIELHTDSIADSTASAKKDRLYRINSLAAEYYHYILTHHPAGAAALTYLRGRGIHEKLIGTFKIGFAPAAGRALTRYLIQKKRFDQQDLIDAGLVTAQRNGLSDFFRGRLMFPLINHRDYVLGFSGRLLDEATGFGGKYINTRETGIYRKREQFFGLNITKEAIRKANQVLLVEGEFDVMSCFQNGLSNVVAVKGTALTAEQVNLLSRYAQKVTICFDGDPAGQEAIKRSLPLLSAKGLHTTVVVIPSGKDPDEALKTKPVEFKQAVENDLNVYDYLFAQAVKQFDAATPDGKRGIADELLPVLGGIENAIVKEHYLRKLSSTIRTTYESIMQELEKRTKNVRIEKTQALITAQKPREEKLGEYLLALVFQNRNAREMLSVVKGLLEGYLPNNRAYQKLLACGMDFAGSGNDDMQHFLQSIPTELIDTYNTVLLYPVPEFSDQEKYLKEVQKITYELRSLYIKEKIKLLSEQINR